MYPHERSLVAKMAGKPFALIGVNSDGKIERAQEAVKKNNLTWRSFWNGPDGTGGPISAKWAIQGWPTLFVIDHKGVIRHKSLGNPGNDKLDGWIEDLVSEAEREAGGK